ncbi:MAG: SAM-dependent methyltransferase, partial [Sphingomonadales bacterium]
MTDVPPPYTAVEGHGVFPRASHDEAARFDFLANFNKFLSGTIGAGNALAYETRVLPQFRREQGRDPADRFEIRHAMNADPWHRFWAAAKRNSMEMRQHNGRQLVLRQLDELDARARQFNEGRDTLQL